MGNFWPGSGSKNDHVKYEEESQKTTTFMGSMGSLLFGFNKKYHPVKGDEESQKTTIQQKNQSDTNNMELKTRKQIHETSDINQSSFSTEHQDDLMRRKDWKILDLEEQVKELTAEKESLRISNTDHQDDLMRRKDLKILALEKQVKELTAEKESLVIRLSQICSVKLSDGNPNITDLSDPNRADKLVSRFSELYDNQWTDSFKVLCESNSILEENAIRDLLQIVLNVYKSCREYAECQNKELVKAVQSFTGVKAGDEVEENILQESIHNLHIFRAKKYPLKMADVKAEIGKYLRKSVDPYVYNICQDYIAECTEVCWLMCVKSPPMYISADKTDTFQHHLYTGYTASGKYVSYVVWPTLFQYKDGPIMQRGVAQGTNKKM